VEKYMKHSAIAIQIAAIFLLTICVTAGEGQSNNNIIDSNRAGMMVPFSQVSKDDFVIDVSQGTTEYMDGAIAIPYTNFLQDNKLRSKEEISGILRDAGVPCDRIIYIYGRCAPCGGGSAPASFAYLILDSLGYQVRLIDDTLEQWTASGGRTTDKPAIKPKTNCTPVVNAEGAESGDQTRIATGNGSRTNGGFAGNLTYGIVNPNGNLSEEVTARFEANSTPSEDTNLAREDMNFTRNVNLQVNKDPGLDQDYDNTCDRDMGVAISLLETVIGKIEGQKKIIKDTLAEMRDEKRIVIGLRQVPISEKFEDEPPGPRRIAVDNEYLCVLFPPERLNEAQRNLINLNREKITLVKDIRDWKYSGNCTRSVPPWVYVLMHDWELDQGVFMPWPSSLPLPT
jgi:hypothetical protein